jgi:hypothetical protein
MRVIRDILVSFQAIREFFMSLVKIRLRLKILSAN